MLRLLLYSYGLVRRHYMMFILASSNTNELFVYCTRQKVATPISINRVLLSHNYPHVRSLGTDYDIYIIMLCFFRLEKTRWLIIYDMHALSLFSVHLKLIIILLRRLGDENLLPNHSCIDFIMPRQLWLCKLLQATR